MKWIYQQYGEKRKYRYSFKLKQSGRSVINWTNVFYKPTDKNTIRKNWKRKGLLLTRLMDTRQASRFCLYLVSHNKWEIFQLTINTAHGQTLYPGQKTDCATFLQEVPRARGIISYARNVRGERLKRNTDMTSCHENNTVHSRNM